MANFDSFGVIRPLSLLSAPQASHYSLPDLKIGNGIDITRLPFSIKILLKSALRHFDGYQIREQDVLKVAGWQAHGTRQEIPFKPARLLLQDFTGAPVLKFFSIALNDKADQREVIFTAGAADGKVLRVL